MVTTEMVTAAGRAVEHLKRMAGGSLPRSLRGCIRLAHEYGIVLEPYRGGTVLIDAGDGPVIYFDPRQSRQRLQCDIIHELAEYLLMSDYPTLFDDIPIEIHADGNDMTGSFRHQVAALVAGAYQKWLTKGKRHGNPCPTQED